MAELTRNLVQQAARDAFGFSEGEEIVTLADGTEYDLSGEWDKIDLYGSVSEALGEEITVNTPREELIKLAEKVGLEVDDYAVNGKIVEDIFEELVGNKLWRPTFVYDFPEDTSTANPLPPLPSGPNRKVGPVHSRFRGGHRLL